MAAGELDRLHELIAGRFGRAEPRVRVRSYVSGLVAGLERKNGWTLAEQAGELSPDGVQRQYSGTAGRTGNCQVGVFLAYASARGHALIDRELYLPRSWTDDRERCREAAIPDETEFATKPQLAQAMISRAVEAGVPFAWLPRMRPTGRLSGCGLGWKSKACPARWPSGAVTRSPWLPGSSALTS